MFYNARVFHVEEVSFFEVTESTLIGTSSEASTQLDDVTTASETAETSATAEGTRRFKILTQFCFSRDIFFRRSQCDICYCVD